MSIAKVLHTDHLTVIGPDPQSLDNKPNNFTARPQKELIAI